MKRIFSKYLILVLLSLLPGLAFAQKTAIRGTIMDGSFDEPMYGANVVWQNKDGRTVGGVQSNFDGTFSMAEALKPGDVLVVSFTGYRKQTVPIVTGQTVYKITLQEERVALKDVEIVAVKKSNAGMMNIDERDLTTSSKKIDMKDLEDLAVADATDALQGRVAGVDMVATSGAPGAGMSIRVRGTTSINGSSEPLIVVDGFPYETTISSDFDFSTADENDYATMLNIAPDDIKDITVLKDAAATAIYGSKGANGVLLINTKRGAISKPTVTYSFKGSVSKPGDGIPMLSGDEYTTLIMDEFFNAGSTFKPMVYPELANDANNAYNYYNYGQNTNWYKELTRTGHTQDHSIAITGGSQKAMYRASFNYYDAAGTTIGENYQRLSTRLNVDYNVSEKIKFSASMNYTYSVTDRNYVTYLKSSVNVLSQAFNRAPNMSVYEYDQAGNLTDNYFTPATDLSGAFWAGSYSNPYNPVAMANDGYYKQKSNRVIPNLSLQWRALSWLRYQLDVSFDVFNTKNNAFVPESATGRPWTETSVNVSNDQDQESFTFQTYNKLFFTPELGESHKLQFVLGFNTSDSRSKGVAIATSNSASTILTDPSNGGLVSGTSSNLSSYSNEVRSVATFAQVQYSFLDRYILGAACNYEGSSKFGDGNRWAFFPSVSGRYRISGEPALQDLMEQWHISELSARFSYGQSGSSRALTNYASQATYNTYAGTYLGNKGNYQSGLQLANLKWEKTSSLNVGVDLGLFDNRYNVHVEWYKKNSNDLIVKDRAIPTSTGFSKAAFLNYAGMENTGWEFDSDLLLYRDKDWNVKFSFNFARNENKLKEDLETTGSWTGNVYSTSSKYPTLLISGQPLGSFYGYIYEGVYLNSDQTIARDANGNKIYTYNDKGVAEPVYMRFNYPTADYTFQAGDAKYKDVNNDGNINEQDVVYLGNGMPLFTGGFGLNAKWKNFSLQTFFNFRYGNDIVNIAKASMESMRSFSNQSTSVLRRWRHAYTDEQIANGEVPSDLLPRAIYAQGYNSLASSRYVEDGSFLRFKTMTLSYQCPKNWFQNRFISEARIYLQMSNIYCWSNYTGMDPEVSISSAQTPGYDTSNTPRSKDFTCGINIKF